MPELEQQEKPEQAEQVLIEEAPRGFGPVIRADDGTEYQATEEDVRSVLPAVAAAIIAMTAWDFSSHNEWTLGADHLFFAHSFLMLVRVVGLGIAGAIMIWGWRDAVANERRKKEEERAKLAAREFVVGKRPGWDE